MSYKIESNGSMRKHLFTPLCSKWNNPSLIIGSKCAGSLDLSMRITRFTGMSSE